MTKLTDLTDKVVGRLLVQRRVEDYIQLNGRKRAQWQCVCACGNTVVVEASNLASNHTRSCGCLVEDICSEIGFDNGTHRRSDTQEWRSWRGARDRCNNPNTKQYINYGARGISMCARWESFENFLADMGNCPANCSLDRVDVNGNYSPDNCRWASATDQMRNRRCTPRVTHDGEIKLLVDLATQYSLPYRAVYERVVRHSWPLEKALTKPLRSYSV